MTELWPWLVLAGLGIFHGLNPAMGWLFAVVLGMHSHSRAVVLAALIPIAGGGPRLEVPFASFSAGLSLKGYALRLGKKVRGRQRLRLSKDPPVIAPTLASRRRWPGPSWWRRPIAARPRTYIGNLRVTLGTTCQRFVRPGPKSKCGEVAWAQAALHGAAGGSAVKPQAEWRLRPGFRAAQLDSVSMGFGTPTRKGDR